MKRVAAMCLAILMVVMLMPTVANAAQAGSVSVTVEADRATVNPGDIVKFQVKLGAVKNMGGMDIYLKIPEGLSIDYGSISIQDGLAGILKSDGDIALPSEKNDLHWSYSTKTGEGYTGTQELTILNFSCKVNGDAALGRKEVTITEESSWFEDTASQTITGIAFSVTPAQLTVEKAKVLVSGVTLSLSQMTLKDGETGKLTAAVAPENADNKNVSWSSDNTAVATVSTDGTVTAVKAGTAKITVTTQNGGKTASCAVTVTCVHAISKDKTEAVEATCDKAGNVEYYACSKCGKKFADADGAKELAEMAIAAKGHQVGAWSKDDDSHWKVCSVCKKVVDKAAHAYKWVVDKAATQDATGLAHEECACGSRRSEGKVLDKLPTYVADKNKPGESDVVKSIENAQPGQQIQVPMGDRGTVASGELLTAAKGKDIEIVLNMGGYVWTIQGKDIMADSQKDVDLKVTMNTKNIKAETVQALAGEKPAIQINLAHEGDFGFRAKLTIGVGTQHAGKYGNLFYYDKAGKMAFVSAGRISADGNVSLSFTHASDYVIVMSEKEMTQSDVSAELTPTKEQGDAAPEKVGEKSPGTGDPAATPLWILVGGSLIGAAACAVRKRMA